ncbi:DNA mismatch repair endonuclease MutL [Clostridium sp. DSM 100503]|uniref:DNA mismatch repair endonuclease MutL n=1 Tax=Clostridium sp. DSM 100503 TaxID=2963282 RepID=UPI00214A68A0|nr:DNA mismatch repair endonuclease MutL [Clostridium sp. DSM 100503]MCR1950047.1 DNA mismatch repair endonuclease MutL [Clostridium sp. DSM 100503]
MKRINLLDEHTSNKIAAGEVVERPSSVVKELVENSIDAEAKNITIEIEEGGISLIRIIDDGNGIHKDDIKKAFMPHATSKIQNVEDIYSIMTLGFRGEALASIASIAKVLLRSKIDGEDFGSEISIEGGEILSKSETGTNKGTIIEVRDLFYNVPARRKFLKSTSREGALISDIVSRIALSNPDVSIKFYNNGKKVLHTYGTGNLKDVIRTVYGKSISENLIYFESAEDAIHLYGYIGKEEIARGSRNNQSIFVNGRYIKNKTIVAAIENAFKSFATVNKFPFFVLFLEVYPEFVDVNIHPTKAEIKFKEDRGIFKKVFDAVHKAFKNEVFNDFYIPEEEQEQKDEVPAEVVEEISFNINVNDTYSNNLPLSQYDDSNNKNNEKEINNMPGVSYEDLRREEELYNNLKNLKELGKLDIKSRNNDSTDYSNVSEYTPINYDSNAIACEDKKETYNNTINKDITTNYDTVNNRDVISSKENLNNIENRSAKFPNLRIIGQFNKTYILAEYDEVLYMIDQHAAHEKILFEKYLKNIEEGDIVVQQLLVPTLIDLTTDDFCYYEENSQVFTIAGFTIENFGGNTIAIKEVPYFLGKLDPRNLFINILDNIKSLGSGKTTEVKYNRIATLACKAAVKANDYLNQMEMEKLINDLRYIDDPFHCPHGRPVIIKFTNYELDKKFRRIV